MSKYCFQSADDRYALFAEALMRGWVAGIRDFPHLMDNTAATDRAMAAAADLLPHTCCAENALADYSRLVSSAWLNAYRAVTDLTEREGFVSASAVKGLPIDEAWELARNGFSSASEARAEVDRVYAQFCSITRDDHK